MSYIHFLCKEDDREATMSLASKMAKEAKPGAIILLTKEEWNVLTTMRTVQIGNVMKEIPGGQE